MTDEKDGPAVERRDAGRDETRRANRTWWDRAAPEYLAEHGDFLGERDLVWGPEGWREEDLGLLADVGGLDVLEIGCGSAPCARWLADHGARVVASDLSAGMLRAAAATPGTPPLLQCDATTLPLAGSAVDLVVSSYGALPFVADVHALFAEAARVLRPGGRLVAATSHPIRWCFPDDPGPAGLTATMSYWDTRAYVEADTGGRPTYVEHHRTVGQWVQAVVTAGLAVSDLVEPTWPRRTQSTWGGWSPHRGAVVPGTLIIVAHKPATSSYSS